MSKSARKNSSADKVRVKRKQSKEALASIGKFPPETQSSKRPMGRPSKYHPGLCDDLLEFFGRPLYITRKIKKFHPVTGQEIEVEIEEPNMTPYLIDWCMKHNLDVVTPSDWAKTHPEFSKAYFAAKKMQERFLAELGIKGDHNAFMSFCALKNVSGWRDKQEIDHGATRELVKIFIPRKGSLKNYVDEDMESTAETDAVSGESGL